VLADTSGFAYAIFPAGSKQTPNHHEQEQITLNIGGTFTMSVGGKPQTLHNKAVLVPSNVEHPITASPDQPSVMLEYQPILRPDWLPPHPPFTSPQSPEPASLASGEPAVADFDPQSSGWQTDETGSRFKRISGKTIRATFYDLTNKGASVNITASPAQRERLVYVLGGRLSSSVGQATREIAKEMLLIVRPTATEVRLSSIGAPNTLVVVFETS
jgi:quercetin dioxygenase-like cupin family protein